MRVGVFLEDVYIFPIVGGGYTVLAEVIESLSEISSESSHAFVVLALNPDLVRTYIKSDNLPIVKILNKGWKANLIKILIFKLLFQFSRKYFYKFVNHWQISTLDMIDKTHDIGMMWFPTPSAMKTKLPYIATIFDLEYRLKPYFPEFKCDDRNCDDRNAAVPQYVQEAAVIITSTLAGLLEIEKLFQVSREQIKVLPYFPPNYALLPEPVADHSILKHFDLEPGYLFYPAQFWPHKNHANLLLALHLLKRKHNLNLHLVLTGSDHGNEAYIRKLINDLDLASQVHILGFVSTAALVTLYRNALALTYVSFLGPDNLPPLEAFAIGTPVIASEVSAAQEQLGNAALIVDPKSPEEIAKAITLIYNDPDLRSRLIRQGKDRINWTSIDYIRGIFSILDDFVPIRRCWEG